MPEPDQGELKSELPVVRALHYLAGMKNLKARLLPAISALNDPAHGGKNACHCCFQGLEPHARVFFNPTAMVFCSEACVVAHARAVLHLNYVIQCEIEAQNVARSS